MEYGGMYGLAGPENEAYLAYSESLVILVKWLLAHQYDIRLVIGDACDTPAITEFRSLLKLRLGSYKEERIKHEPILSTQELLSQLAAADLVVATRFHNVLLALLLNKPVISISFHDKCASLMADMGLSDYCQDINHLSADRLIQRFLQVEENAQMLKDLIKRKVGRQCQALEEQYKIILKENRAV